MGYFPTRIIPLSTGTIEIRITKVGSKIGRTTKITGEIPTGLDRQNAYYDAVLAGLSKNWWKTRGGYVGQDEEMTTAMAKDFLSRVLEYQILKAGTNREKKQLAINNRDLFARSSATLESKKWNRGAFSELLLKSLRIPLDSVPPVWLDEKCEWQDTLATLRTQYFFQWQDQFGIKYFQPDRIITLAEAMYLAGEVTR